MGKKKEKPPAKGENSDITVEAGDSTSETPGPDAPEAPEVESIKRISLEPDSLSLTVSEFKSLTATVQGSGEEEVQILWGSLDSSIAKVTGSGNEGIVTGVAAGNTTVFAVIAGVGSNAEAEVRVT